MDFETYKKLPGVNWSSLKALRVSPKQYEHERRNEREDANYFRIGRAMHAFILEPDTFQHRYVCYLGRRAGKIWDAFEEANADKTILNESEWTRALGMATAITTHPIAAGYLLDGLCETVVAWDDAESGLRLKGRVDYCGLHLVDLKSAASIQPRLFATAAARLGYIAQLAYYSDGLAASGIDVDPEPVLIAVESSAPYDVIVYRVPEHVVELGRTEYRRLLSLLAECMDKGEWPGRAPDREIPLILPEWAYAQVSDEVELTMGGVPMEGI
jgi:PDDEXK-like uncharacterized protein DUF3799